MERAQPPHDPLAVMLLARLRHLLAIEAAACGNPLDDASRLLVSKAIFSTWLDCQELGAGREATQLLGRHAPPSTGGAVSAGGV